MAEIRIKPINEQAVKEYIGESPTMGLLAHVYHIEIDDSPFEKISIWVRYRPHDLDGEKRKYLLDFKFTLEHHHHVSKFFDYAEDLNPIEIERSDRDVYLSFSIPEISNTEIRPVVEMVFKGVKKGKFSLIPYDEAKGKIKGGKRFSKKKY